MRHSAYFIAVGLAMLMLFLISACGSGETGGERNSQGATQNEPTPTPVPTPTPRPPKTLTLEEGVVAEVSTWGSGDEPGEGSAVQLHYVLRTAEGEELDSTREREGVYEVVLSESTAPPGLVMALKRLPAGSLATITLPPGAAFGDLGYGEVIPSGATLVLDVEVLKIEEAP